MKTVIKLTPRRNPAPVERPKTAMERLRSAYSLSQYLLFIGGAYGTLLAMTAMGRAGA
ncbi:hypothetical protein [Sphingobium yanoikuyae]|uniref:hypothetical protein n=1 Tax=Sphingobium yanoikuyae TaxID=13690 RepID=UPI0013E0A5C9|nr:hypothetical protein [Sphingobium yanoikuyae]